jgi:hypothetical protein
MIGVIHSMGKAIYTIERRKKIRLRMQLSSPCPATKKKEKNERKLVVIIKNEITSKV